MPHLRLKNLLRARGLLPIIAAIALISCRTNLLDKSWTPQKPALSISSFQCLQTIQPYTKGQVLSFNWYSKDLKIKYHYSISALAGKDVPEFILQDEFGNTFTLFTENPNNFLCTPQETNIYCLSYELPLEGKPIQSKKVKWSDGVLSLMNDELKPAVDLAKIIPKLFDRSFVQEDIQRRYNRFTKEVKNNLIPPNIKRQAELDRLKCESASNP